MLLALAPAVAFSAIVAPAPPDAIPKAPAWQMPRAQEVRARAVEWLQKAAADAQGRAKAEAIWTGVSDKTAGMDLLDRLSATFALADSRAARLIEVCSKPRAAAILPSQAWLTDPKTPPWEAANLRLLYGRWLVQGFWFDEAIEQLAGLKPEDVVAPAELLFFQSVAYHRLLRKDEGLKALDQLLDGAEGSPRRYVAVAILMQADLKGLEPDTLDHIARRMDDIERRLDLGRAGPKVRKVEDGVVESLDKLIKKIEDQQKQQQSQGGGGALQSRSPAPKSALLAGRGPGEVARKNIGNKSGWGDLPPKEREEALQHLGREFPAHYRDIVEQYFRRLAAEEGSEHK
ncbi:MAG: hypothetical protein ABR915_02480 [Thermoguttaceae bacterium]|jgi:hypothetical protein